MKIKRLHLENFRKHADSTLEFGGASFVVIRGRNFAGKSSIKQAISLSLTPTTEGLGAAGQGFVSKIKRGTSKAVITVDIQGKNHLIQRVVTLNTNSTGRTPRSICLDDPSWNPANFDKQIEDNRAALTVVLNTDAFLRMDAGEQKNLLARLALPTRYDFNGGIVQAVEKILGKGVVSFADEPFAVINQAYSKLFDERQIANRQVKDFILPEPLPMPAGDSHGLEVQLSTLREERRKRVEERDKAVADATTVEIGRVRARSKVEALEEAIRKEQGKADALKAKLQPDDKLVYLRTLANGQEEREKLIKEHDAKTKLLNDSIDRSTQLGKGTGKNCPTCNQPLDPGILLAMRNTVARQIVEERDAVELLSQKIRALGDVGAAVILINGHDKVLQELATVEGSLDDLKRQLGEEQKTVPVAEEFNFQPYDKSIQECDAEIERLAGLLRPAIAAEERTKEIVIKRQQLNSLKERASTLDELVRFFDKDGIKASLLKTYIGGFENKVNETMSAWGYSCSLSMEPYSFDVTNADGDVVPVRELSGAERVMFSLAFQCAVSRTANIGLVVIDEISMFLPELRPVLYRRVYEMISNGLLEQAILLVADTSENVPDLPMSAFFLVRDGQVVQLRRAKWDAQVGTLDASVAN